MPSALEGVLPVYAGLNLRIIVNHVRLSVVLPVSAGLNLPLAPIVAA